MDNKGELGLIDAMALASLCHEPFIRSQDS